MADLRNKKDWEKIQTELKEQYPILTDNDFTMDDRDKFMNHLEGKLGKPKEEIRDIIKKI